MTEINNWMNKYFLKLNPVKTEIILLCPPNLKSVSKINGVFIGNTCIRFSSKVKLLGVHIDNYLDFDHHVSKIVSSSMYHLKNIAKLKRYLSQSDTEKLVHALISSKLDYCNAVLFGVKSSSIAKLQTVQNKAAMLVLGLRAHASVTDVLLNNLHWLKIDLRIVFKLLLLSHKFFINTAPEYFTKQLTVVNHSERLLRVLHLQSKYGQRSFSY